METIVKTKPPRVWKHTDPGKLAVAKYHESFRNILKLRQLRNESKKLDRHFKIVERAKRKQEWAATPKPTFA